MQGKMNNKKQTAFCQYVNDTLKGEAKEVSYYLELEKQQIVEHHTSLLSGVMGEESAREDAEQYYKETFK